MIEDSLFFVILGITIIIVDLHTTTFLSPLGVFFIAFGTLLSLEISYLYSLVISALLSLSSYFFLATFFKKETKDMGKSEYSFELKGKIGIVKRFEGDYIIVELEGEDWLALPAKEGLKFNIGEKVRIVDTRGIKLVIDRLDNKKMIGNNKVVGIF